VQTGCAEACSYCIIPTTRGMPRSVASADVLREVDRVAAAGFKEIALTGVHLGSYGRDLTPRSSLIDLLCALEVRSAPPSRGMRSGVPRRSSVGQEPSGGGRLSAERVLFRISSLEPMDCSRDIVDLVATSDGFAPHFHLPV